MISVQCNSLKDWTRTIPAVFTCRRCSMALSRCPCACSIAACSVNTSRSDWDSSFLKQLPRLFHIDWGLLRTSLPLVHPYRTQHDTNMSFIMKSIHSVTYSSVDLAYACHRDKNDSFVKPGISKNARTMKGRSSRKACSCELVKTGRTAAVYCIGRWHQLWTFMELLFLLLRCGVQQIQTFPAALNSIHKSSCLY